MTVISLADHVARSADDNEMHSLEGWEAMLTASGFAHRTIRLRTSIIANLLRSAGVSPSGLTRAHVIRFLGRPDLAPATRHAYYQAVKSWCEYCATIGAPADLLEGVRRPRVPSGTARPIDDDTIRALLELDLHPRTHAYVRLALFQALRVHEVAKIKGSDFVDGWLTVVGKGGGAARIPVHPEVEALRSQYPAAAPWFPTQSGVVTPHGVSSAIKAALKRVGSDANPHRLRDSAATRLQREGRDLRVTQAFLRHVSVRSSQKYAGVSDRQLVEATNYLDWDAGVAL